VKTADRTEHQDGLPLSYDDVSFLKHRWLDKRDADFMLTHSSEDITFENLMAWVTIIALWRFLAETPPA